MTTGVVHGAGRQHEQEKSVSTLFVSAAVIVVIVVPGASSWIVRRVILLLVYLGAEDKIPA